MDKKEEFRGVVFKELNTLRKNLNDVIANSRRLRTRLEPVLYSLEKEPCDEEKIKDEASSPLRSELMELNTTVYEIKRIQHDIENRLEIGEDRSEKEVRVQKGN